LQSSGALQTRFRFPSFSNSWCFIKQEEGKAGGWCYNKTSEGNPLFISLIVRRVDNYCLWVRVGMSFPNKVSPLDSEKICPNGYLIKKLTMVAVPVDTFYHPSGRLSLGGSTSSKALHIIHLIWCVLRHFLFNSMIITPHDYKSQERSQSRKWGSEPCSTSPRFLLIFALENCWGRVVSRTN
jgi:hypothetical protein